MCRSDRNFKEGRAMHDKRIGKTNEQHPKQTISSDTNVGSNQTNAPMANQNMMSNSIEKQDLRQTRQINAQTAYTVMNRNGMINSVDPANQNLRLSQAGDEPSADAAPVLQSNVASAPAKHSDSAKKPTPHLHK